MVSLGRSVPERGETVRSNFWRELKSEGVSWHKSTQRREKRTGALLCRPHSEDEELLELAPVSFDLATGIGATATQKNLWKCVWLLVLPCW